jgi:hypothetical protein
MSSISGINPNSYSIPFSVNSQANPFKQDLTALQSSLQSGDLSGAQTAFNSLQQLLQSGPGGTTPSSNTSPNSIGGNSVIQNDLQGVQSALQSGDINAAKSAFTKLKTDLHSVGGHHGHHHKGAPAADNDVNSLLNSLTANSSSSSTDTTGSSSNPFAPTAGTGNTINQLT